MAKYEIVQSYDDRIENIRMMESLGIFSTMVGCPKPETGPAESLRSAADLFESRNREYGESYKDFGSLMMEIFPEGITLKSSKDFSRYGIFNMMMSKIHRYSANWGKGGHSDSLDDLSVYSQMLKELDK